MISSAYANVANGIESQAFYTGPAFWVAIAFLCFVIIFTKPIWKFATSALDKKIKAIEDSIEESAKLREDAQDLLAKYKRKLSDAEVEAQNIISEAREDAGALKDKLTRELEATLERKEKQAMERISQAENEAREEFRTITADLAIAATRQVLFEQIEQSKADELIDEAITELPDRLS